MSSRNISAKVRSRVFQQAGSRCDYCLSLQKYVLGIKKKHYIIFIKLLLLR